MLPLDDNSDFPQTYLSALNLQFLPSVPVLFDFPVYPLVIILHLLPLLVVSLLDLL